MFPLWDVAIAPVLTACRARKVVEIGALRGENTVQILDHLGPEGELHVIDPVPDFDPAEHEQRWPGRYFFHEALSLDVLPGLEPMDAALIDGDHNWWTVYNECRMLAQNALAADRFMPVMILHDVAWPYGRRDLYYDPSNVPEERRQPYDFLGMKPGMKKLAKHGGLNPTMANALEEGGERNGVMTGLDDFVAEHPNPIRQVVLPFYFGLAIVAEEAHLAAEPELAAAFDRLESSEARFDMLEVAEDIRIKAMLFQHNVFFQREQFQARSAARYLGVVKSALLDEHYLENEVRIENLYDAARNGTKLSAAELRDPLRFDRPRSNRVQRGRAGIPDKRANSSFLPYTAMGRSRLEHLEACAEHVRANGIDGDFVECGTGRGGGAIFLKAFVEGHEMKDPHVWVADVFRSSPEGENAPTIPKRGIDGFQADLNMVREGFARFDLLDDRVSFVTGPLDRAPGEAPIEKIALLRIGHGVGAKTAAILEQLYDKLAVGGVVIVDEHAHDTTREAVEEFHERRGIQAPIDRVDDAMVAWVRSEDDGTAETVAASPSHRGAPLLPPRVEGTVDLTMVVVFYNMRREAARTLRSLSRSYQEGIDDLTYEVIAIDNGSDPDQRLDEEFVTSFGPEFRFVEIGDDAQSSPVFALNHGIELGRGRNFGLMIDGAHVVTPGVLRFASMALREHAPAMVATQQWYVGPGQQGEAMIGGYDQDYEDALFEKIGWPRAGYRLFEIGSFVGDRDWFDGVWESNCLFVSREQLQQVGGFDESFDVSGGSYSNLEIYERIGNSPGLTVCTMIGEGSFHQTHGGTTTNQPDAVTRRNRVFGYSQDYAELRGRPFKGPGKPLHFVGRLPNGAARRSKPRRLGSRAFVEDLAIDGQPTTPSPMPDELASAFTEAVWHTLPWRDTTWLGRAITTAPTDLLAYQQLITDVRPDVIVETGAADGGRSLFLASICELAECGTVVAVGADPADRPTHARLTHLDGSVTDTAVEEQIAALVGDGRALVVLGGAADRATTYREFSRLERFVPVGSYVVVTETILNGRPVWPAFGPGPGEGVKQILGERGDFVADHSMEKYSLSFNPGGFLKRIG
ncbi:MAG: CmcI family methyltransferase [Acidimicrobiales bacterium]